MLLSGFFEPLFYLLSIGLGLNHLVGHLDGRRAGRSPTPTTSRPGLLASSAMNGAIFDATFGIFFKLKIAKTYDAVLATPLGVRDVAIGELPGRSSAEPSTRSPSWWSWRLSGWSRPGGPWLCLPAAMLVSFAFGGIGMFGTCYMRSWQDFDLISLAIVPLFLFSGVFYPLSLYPGLAPHRGDGDAPVPRRRPATRPRHRRGRPGLLVHACYLGVLGTIGLAGASRRLAKPAARLTES